MSDSDLRRRHVLKLLGLAGAGVALDVPLGCVLDIPEAPTVNVDGLVANGTLSLPLSRAPALTEPGGAVACRSNQLPFPVLALHLADGSYAALPDVCSHKGCPLGFNGQEVLCPCHGSRFTPQGQVTHPPAVANLLALTTRLDASTQTLEISVGGV
jgi:Rieske Fe-S protein